jgi:Ca2+:H+ antiporter
MRGRSFHGKQASLSRDRARRAAFSGSMSAHADSVNDKRTPMPHWAWLIPVAAAALLGWTLAFPPGTAMAALCFVALMATVIAAVHHAEVVAHRVGEPFGTLVLALAITVIEVALIITVMRGGGKGSEALARDTLFAAIMIICNGVLGLCLLFGGLRHHEQVFRVEGAHAALAALITMSTLSLVLPNFTLTTPGPTYTAAQLEFAAIASLAVWCVFVFVQTVRHRDYFVPSGDDDPEAHAARPSVTIAWASFALLCVALVTVVGLAKILSPTIERVLAQAGAPPSMIGVVIALLVLLPETWAALRAALDNRLQTSFNLALGSALASIGLTIPVVAAASILFGFPLILGLDIKDIVLLVLTYLVTTLTLASGRTNMMQGAVHLVIFAAFVFLAFVP